MADSGPDHGLFQVNIFWSSDRSNPPNWLAAQGIAQSHDELFDPRINIRAALAILAREMRSWISASLRACSSASLSLWERCRSLAAFSGSGLAS